MEVALAYVFDDPAVGKEKFGVGHGVEVHGCVLQEVWAGLAGVVPVSLCLDFTHFKRHERGSLRVDDTEYREVLNIWVSCGQ